jgi:DsbC/DsbD-like thiol-disulfide interchange protein
MIMKIRYFIFLTFAVLILGTAAGAQTISGSVTGGAVARGSSARGVITMSIPGGLHVNSNRPSSEYSIPTTVSVTARGARIGRISYPRGADRKFGFSETPINVYQGTVRFPFTVSVPANYRGRTISLRAVVRYQACTNEVCYPPKNKEITFTARAR